MSLYSSTISRCMRSLRAKITAPTSLTMAMSANIFYRAPQPQVLEGFHTNRDVLLASKDYLSSKKDKKKKKSTEASKYDIAFIEPPSSSHPKNIHRGSTGSKSRSSTATSHKRHGGISSRKHQKNRLASSSSDKFIQQMADLIARYMKAAHNKMERKRTFAALRNMVDEDME
eukprot:GEZU01023655.1.p1 GENE.GEZU01023655.1~~GEZU01023655.1.p1  ORF type:complete len:172 (-),score=17.12 GEZU01023655.1:250-765(-)